MSSRGKSERGRNRDSSLSDASEGGPRTPGSKTTISPGSRNTISPGSTRSPTSQVLLTDILK